MTGHRAVKSFKKSSVPGVVITQFVDEIPKGCSTPDFEKKPVTLTLQEGKNAIFRAVVKGVPTPDVKWTRTQGGMDDPDKYQTFFNNATNEFILQINKPTVNDSDLYRCLAVNEYGEAACSAGLRIIQVGFKRKTKYVPVHPAEELKKKLQDFRKLLRKRAPVQKPKPLDKEAVWQLLLHADRRDYEKICIKYGIVDFRGMLRKLQEIKKDTESEQGELIHSIKNFEHIKVNKDGKASFSLEMDLKNSKSKVYLLKDGEKLRYGAGDEYRKHCLRQIGKRYHFIVNDVQPEDAGVYQVRVEDVPVFSTELEAECIPVRFEQPLSDIRCPEEENAVFKCVLRTPCYDAVWLHKTHLLEASEKHQISVTPDGLTHQLVIKNVVPSDNGMYTLDTGLCSSNAWLIVEYAKGKRRQGEGNEREKPEQLKETFPDKERAKKPQHREYVDDEDHLIDTGMEKNGWYRNGQDSSQGHSVDVDGSHHRFLGKDGLRKVHKNERMGSGQFSGAGLDGDSMTNDGSSFELNILGGKSRLRPVQGKDSTAGRADTGHELGQAGEGYPVDGRDDDMLGADMDGGEIVGGQLDEDGRLGDSYRAGFGGGGRLDATDGSSRLDGLNPDSTRVGGGKGDLFSRNSLGTGTRKNAAGTKTAGGMRSPHGRDGLPTAVDMNGASINREGQTGSSYGKDSLKLHASGRLDQAGISGLLYGPGHLPTGDGAICSEGGSSIGEMAALYSPDGQPVGAGICDTGVAGAGRFGSPFGKDGLLAEGGLSGTGVAGAGGIGSPYGQDGFPAGGSVGGATVGFGGAGFAYGKDGLPAGAGVGGTGGFGSPYGKDGLPAGAGAGGSGSPYGKDGSPAGVGVGGDTFGGFGGIGSPYGKDGRPAGTDNGGATVGSFGGLGTQYGKDGFPAGADIGSAGVTNTGGVGFPFGKDGLPAGAGIGGAGVGGALGLGSPYGKDGLSDGATAGGAGVALAEGVGSPYGNDSLLAGAGTGIAGVGFPYGKDGLPAGAGVGGAGVAGEGELGSPYGKDGHPLGGAHVAGARSQYGKVGLPAAADIGGAGVDGAGGVESLYGKDGLPAGAGIGGAGVGGAGRTGSPYGKDGLLAGAGVGGAGAGALGSPYGKDGIPAGAGVGGADVPGTGGVESPYGKGGFPAGAGTGVGAGAGVAGRVGSPYGKDGVPVGAGAGGAGVAEEGRVESPYGKDGGSLGGAGIGSGGAWGVGSRYGKDGLPAGAGFGGVGAAGGVGSPCGKGGLQAGAGIGGAGAGALGSPYGKDGLPVGAGIGATGIRGMGGVESPYGKDGLPAGAGIGGAAVAGEGCVVSPYGKDHLPVDTGIGGAGAGALSSPYGKNGLPFGAGVGGASVPGTGGVGSPYGKDGFPAGAGVSAAGVGGAGGVGSFYGKDGLPPGAGVGGADAGALGSLYGKDGLPAGAGVGAGTVASAGGVGFQHGKDGLLAGSGIGGAAVGGAGGVGSPYGKDGLPAGAGVSAAGVAGAGRVGSPYGKDGLPAGAGVGAAGVGGAGGVGSPYGKDGLPAGAGISAATVGGAGGVGSPYGKDGLPAGAGFGAAGVGGAGGVGSLYGKDGLPAGAGFGAAGVGGSGGVGSPYGKDGLPAGTGFGAAGVGGAGGVGSPYGKDGLPAGAGFGAAGVGGAGGVGSPYGKDGLPAGAGVGAAGVGGAGGVGSPYGKDGLPAGSGVSAAGVGGSGGIGSPYGKDGLPAGAGFGAAGVGGAGGVGSPYGKDGLPAGAGVSAAGVGGAGGVGSPYGKDGLPAGAGVGAAGVGGAGGVGSPYGKDGLLAGAVVGAAGVGGSGGVGSPYGKDGLPAGAGVGAAGVGGAGGVGSPYGKDGLPAGAGIVGAGLGGAGGVGSPYGKDGLPAGAGFGAAGVGGAGGVGSPYGKDGLPSGTGFGGAGVDGAGGVGSPYGKDGLPAGAGFGGAGVGGGGRVGSPYGKDGLPAGAGVGGAAVGGYGGAGSPYGEGVFPAGVVAGAVQFPFVGNEDMRSHHGRNAMLTRAQGYLGGAGGGDSSSEVGGVGGSAVRSVRSPYSKDSGSAGARAGVGGDGREMLSNHGGEGVVGAVGRGGEYGLDSHPGKSSVGGETGKGTASDFRGSGNKSSPHIRDSLSGQRDAREKGRDLGQLGSHYGRNSALGGAGSASYDSSVTGNSSTFGHGSLHYGQMVDLYGGLPSINHRKPELELDLKENDFLKNTESLGNKRRYCLDDLKAPRCHLNKQLLGVRVLKGEPAELSCTVSKEDVTGTWFKDGLKLKSMDGVVFEKEGLVHKLIINKVEDIHAGKYRFEGGDIKTEASIFVEDPPQVDKVLLKNLTSVPTVAKAGQKVQIKIPFEGRLPIRAMWLKDKMELVDDTRIRVDNTETFTMLSISSSERKDCGDYKVRLKNDSGALEINLRLLVLDKPQPPAGPIKIVQSSVNDITIQWKAPKDDGGKPLQRYVVERQQVGKSDWVTLGETPRTCTTFTTNKVEQDMSYYFRVRAVNAEGTSDALESDEVKAVGKASPGAPDAPEVVSTSKDSITISWKAPCKTGSSRIVGYIIQKRKKGTMTWLPVNNAPVSDKKLKITNLKKGLQYEFRVAAVNDAGIGDASGPSQPAFARDSTKTLGPVQDLKVSSSDSSSVTLTWKTPETKNGSDVKGYEVEVRPSTSLNWTKCTTLPLEMTTYTVKGLQAKETYFLRVRALNDSGPGEATEIEACMEAAPPVVSPRFLIDDTVKSFLLIKAGDTIRVNIPFEASPDPVVTWLKDGQLLPNQPAITTKDGTTQLLIGAAAFTDSGTYTIELQNGLGKRETFSFQVQVTDIPQPPGPIHLEENVPNTVTVTWEPSASERWESHLYYTVLKRESEKGLWHVVGDLIYNNKFTFTQLIPGRDYYFKVVAKNCLGASGPSETAKPWRIQKIKAEPKVKPQQYRGVNQSQPPRILAPLKPHVVTTGSECRMSCAVAGHPSPKITWYKDSRDLSSDPAYLCTNDFGVCSLVILGVTAQDEGEYMVEASNEMGRAFSKAFLTIKDSTL